MKEAFEVQTSRRGRNLSLVPNDERSTSTTSTTTSTTTTTSTSTKPKLKRKIIKNIKINKGKCEAIRPKIVEKAIELTLAEWPSGLGHTTKSLPTSVQS